MRNPAKNAPPRRSTLAQAHVEQVRRGGLYAFVRLAWSQIESGKFSDNWHIEEICAHLEAVSRRECRKLIINIPPGCMKSLLVSVFWPVWHWINTPGEKWLYASFDPTLSLRDALKAKSLIESAWFRERWGDSLAVDTTGRRANSASEYYTTSKGLRFSTSIKGKATGWHSGIQVVDDPNKAQDTKGGSEATGVKLQESVDWFTGVASSRQSDPELFCRVVVMQRLHERDLTGFLEAGGDYTVLRLPMEYDPEHRCETPWGGDRRTVAGELLWEGRHGPEVIKALKHPITGLSAADYAAQYQQRPMPKTGGIFKLAHFKRRYLSLPTESLSWLTSWDMRFIDANTRGDFVVGTVWAYRQAEFYLVKVYRGRWSFSETVEMMIQASQDYPQATAKLVEDKANGPAVVNTLRNEVPGMILVNPEGGKESRANAVQPLFEAGNVILPDDSLGLPWVKEYIDEMCSFPRGMFDDQVDSTSQALLRLKASFLFKFLAAMEAANEGKKP